MVSSAQCQRRTQLAVIDALIRNLKFVCLENTVARHQRHPRPGRADGRDQAWRAGLQRRLGPLLQCDDPHRHGRVDGGAGVHSRVEVEALLGLHHWRHGAVVHPVPAHAGRRPQLLLQLQLPGKTPQERTDGGSAGACQPGVFHRHPGVRRGTDRRLGGGDVQDPRPGAGRHGRAAGDHGDPGGGDFRGTGNPHGPARGVSQSHAVGGQHCVGRVVVDGDPDGAGDGGDGALHRPAVPDGDDSGADGDDLHHPDRQRDQPQ